MLWFELSGVLLLMLPRTEFEYKDEKVDAGRRENPSLPVDPSMREAASRDIL